MEQKFLRLQPQRTTPHAPAAPMSSSPLPLSLNDAIAEVLRCGDGERRKGLILSSIVPLLPDGLWEGGSGCLGASVEKVLDVGDVELTRVLVSLLKDPGLPEDRKMELSGALLSALRGSQLGLPTMNKLMSLAGVSQALVDEEIRLKAKSLTIFLKEDAGDRDAGVEDGTAAVYGTDKRCDDDDDDDLEPYKGVVEKFVQDFKR